jgi:hypothetical protein
VAWFKEWKVVGNRTVYEERGKRGRGRGRGYKESLVRIIAPRSHGGFILRIKKWYQSPDSMGAYEGTAARGSTRQNAKVDAKFRK